MGARSIVDVSEAVTPVGVARFNDSKLFRKLFSRTYGVFANTLNIHTTDQGR